MKPHVLIIFSWILIFFSCSVQDHTEEAPMTEGTWWKEATIYQIYPRSFKDTDGDGVGDLRGIIESLDYIKSLGIQAVWLNPIYESPNDDNGYDVSDYRAIMAEFGTMSDFDEMLQGMHDRDIKLIMDIVVNHSSDEHEWFKASRSSRDNPYRDYYHWWPAEKGEPPYRYSLFDAKGEAWKYDSLTNAYYLHYFSQKQPDLNWSNTKLRTEVHDIMKFWAEKGVDGFRMDAFQFVAKDTTFPEFPNGFERDFMNYYAMQDGIHDYIKEMHEEVFGPYEVMTVAEGAGRNFKEAHELVDADRNEFSMAYAFDAVDIAKYEGYDLMKVKDVFSRWDSAFAEKGWLSIFLSNHDQARLVSRFGDDSEAFRSYSAKMLNTFILSMRGTPYCYYGDELGMTNMDFDGIKDYKDIAAKNGYIKAKNEGQDMDYFLKKLNFESRDNGRTPMQWDTSQYAGFSDAEPWMPVNENYVHINVANQNDDPQSILNHFRKMTHLRSSEPALIYGAYNLIDRDHPQVYAYTRTWDSTQLVVLLNFSREEANFSLDNLTGTKEVLINNYSEVEIRDNLARLKPYQAIIFRLNQ